MSRFEDHRMSFDVSDDQYRGFDLSEDEETARGPLILALALGVLIVFAAVVWNTYRQGIREPGEVPLIRAETAPYKTPGEPVAADPADSVGESFYREFERDPGAGDLRLDRGGYQVTDTAGADATLQGGPAIDLTGDLGSSGAPGAPTPREDQLQALSELAEEVLEDLGQAPASPAPEQETSAEATAALTAPKTPEGAPEAASGPGPDQAPAAPAPKPRVPGIATDGAFLVQLAAYRTAEAADTGWADLMTRHEPLFSATEKRVQRADLEARGVFYRLRAGAFETRNDAAGFCDRLKGEGIDCIVVGG